MRANIKKNTLIGTFEAFYLQSTFFFFFLKTLKVLTAMSKRVYQTILSPQITMDLKTQPEIESDVSALSWTRRGDRN